MHVVVVGCGRVGSELAGMLEEGGHSVAVVDKRKEAFRRLPRGFGGARVVGFGFDRDSLEEAGIRDAEAFAAVTSGDNSNILSARVAREIFGVDRVVARIYDPRRAMIYQRLGIPTVATVSWTTDQVLRRLVPTDASSGRVWLDPTAKVCLIERPLPDAWAGHKLDELNEPGEFLLTAITRFGAADVVGRKAIGQEGDVAHFVVAIDATDALQDRLDQGPGAA